LTISQNRRSQRRYQAKPPVSEPKTRENTVLSSSAVPKAKEQAVTDARKKYVSEKLKTKANIEKAAQEGQSEGVARTDYQPKRTEIFSANENIPKQQTQAQAVKYETPTPKVKTENSVDTAFSSKSMPKTKESYMRSQGKTPADIIKTPDRAKAQRCILGYARNNLTGRNGYKRRNHRKGHIYYDKHQNKR